MVANVRVEFTSVQRTSEGADEFAPKIRTSEDMTSLVTSAQTTATARVGEVVRVRATLGDVYVLAGDSPTASATTGYLVKQDTFLTLGPLQDGDQVAAIDV